MEVKYWHDQEEQAIIVLHCPSGERREIKNPKKVKQFLQTYGVTLEKCKGVIEDIDRLHLFKKMQIRKKQVCQHGS